MLVFIKRPTATRNKIYRLTLPKQPPAHWVWQLKHSLVSVWRYSGGSQVETHVLSNL